MGGSRGSQGVKGDVWGVPLGHRVGLRSLLMIHEAYMPVYIGSRFSLRTGGQAQQPEVVQEALADLKSSMMGIPAIIFLIDLSF